MAWNAPLPPPTMTTGFSAVSVPDARSLRNNYHWWTVINQLYACILRGTGHVVLLGLGRVGGNVDLAVGYGNLEGV